MINKIVFVLLVFLVISCVEKENDVVNLSIDVMDNPFQKMNSRGSVLMKIDFFEKAILQNDGKIKLLEKWQWLCDDMSQGESELIEIS